MRPVTIHLLSFLAALAILVSGAPRADGGEDWITLHGKKIDIYFLPGSETVKTLKPIVLYLPGDGGWRGFAITMAKTIAGWGYDTYAIDSRDYLAAFTGKKTTLTPSDIMEDFHVLGDWMNKKPPSSVTLIGWSEGAGLALAAVAPDSNKAIFNGLVTIGLGARSVLGWKTIDDLTWITGKEQNEPTFNSADYMAKVSPLPLVMIQSSGDTDAPVSKARILFQIAREPKQFHEVKARNHRFDGNTDDFFLTLRNSLQWIQELQR